MSCTAWRPAIYGYVILALIASVVCLRAEEQEHLTQEQMRDFLLTAKIVSSKPIGKGKSAPWRLTLRNETRVQDAAFQYIDEYKPYMKFDTGQTEMNFRDSYKYTIAAYELSRILGISDMMPVTVERKYNGKPGALSWWLPVKMDEGQRIRKRLDPPDRAAWNRQMHKLRVFSQLVYDTDRNLGNILISEDWHIWMIDFSRAFRLYHTLENAKNLERCDRKLLQRLRELDAAELQQRTKDLLNEMEIEGLMMRRDKIIAHFENLVARKGEAEVLY